LSQRLKRPPKLSELADDLGVSEEHVLEAMEVGERTARHHSARVLATTASR
jgi:DNA-directed RNA polymerase specialized sigma subunit